MFIKSIQQIEVKIKRNKFQPAFYQKVTIHQQLKFSQPYSSVYVVIVTRYWSYSHRVRCGMGQNVLRELQQHDRKVEASLSLKYVHEYQTNGYVLLYFRALVVDHLQVCWAKRSLHVEPTLIQLAVSHLMSFLERYDTYCD